MNTFISYAPFIRQLLTCIVDVNQWHAKWLNTLSFLENCGAREIAACEHPTLVKGEMLKHAAEEFRHAHHLKRQIQKVSMQCIETYGPSLLFGGITTRHYLTALNLKTSQYLKASGLSKQAIKEAAYLLVTYAIELRANELYHIYDEILRQAHSKVVVKSILLEEKEHLNEMEEGLKQLSNGLLHAQYVCKIESLLTEKWLNACWQEVQFSVNLPL